MKNIFLFIFTILIFSCSKPTTCVSLNITDDSVENVILSNPFYNILDTLISKSTEIHSIDFGEDVKLLKLRAGKINQYIYVVNGDKIEISKSAVDPNFNIKSKYQVEQDLLTSFEKELAAIEENNRLSSFVKFSLDSFNMMLDSKYAPLKDMLQSNEIKADLQLVSWLKERVEAIKDEAKIIYPDYNNYVNKTKNIMPESYYDFTQKFDFNNKSLKQFSDVRSAGQSMIGYEIKYDDYEKMSDYYLAKIRAVDARVKNEDMNEYYKYSMLHENVDYSGVDGVEEEVNAFSDGMKNQIFKQELLASVKKWNHLKKGLQAPDFVAYDRGGNEVKLSDLKGKNVYVDVWATWCGPCIAEIPALKEMEKKYRDKDVEFVSVSIDDLKDKEKWKIFIEEKELSGTQIMGENAWKSEVATKYNINGIPRFFMVDQQGKLVNANAPRPSETKAFELMLSELITLGSSSSVQ